MKKLNVITLTTTMLLSAFAGLALTSDRYVETMRKTISELYAASAPDDFKKTVNIFERIAAAEKTRWEPYYYAGFGYIMLANLESDALRKDNYLDQAFSAVEKAKSLSAGESEIISLEGFVYMIRVTVDPASRGAEFAPRAMQSFEKATALNPENPRALTLTAQMQYGSAQFFGNSTGEACATLKKALEKFETYEDENPLAPQWGKGMATSLAAKCK